MISPKLLGQSAPNAATLTALYIAPICARTTIDTLTICNRAAVASTFRTSVAPKGVADAVAHYLYYDTAIAGNATLNLTELNISLTETDELRVYATAATLSFSAFGTEVQVPSAPTNAPSIAEQTHGRPNEQRQNSGRKAD